MQCMSEIYITQILYKITRDTLKESISRSDRVSKTCRFKKGKRKKRDSKTGQLKKTWQSSAQIYCSLNIWNDGVPVSTHCPSFSYMKMQTDFVLNFLEITMSKIYANLLLPVLQILYTTITSKMHHASVIASENIKGYQTNLIRYIWNLCQSKQKALQFIYPLSTIRLHCRSKF